MNIQVIKSQKQLLMTYSSINAAGRFVDGSADRRNGLFKESLTSSSTFSVMVAENNMVCLLLGHNFTWRAITITSKICSETELQILHQRNDRVKNKLNFRKTNKKEWKRVAQTNKENKLCMEWLLHEVLHNFYKQKSVMSF